MPHTASRRALGALGLLALTACAATVHYGSWSGAPTGSHRIERRIEGDLPPVEGFAALDVTQSLGDVDVRALEDGARRYVARVVAWAETDRRAQEIAEGVSPRFEVNGHELDVRVDAPDRGDARTEGYQVNWELLVPNHLAVTISTDGGRIDVEGPVSSCRATSKFGDVQLRSAAGDVTLSSSSGNVQADDIANARQVQLTTSFGDVASSDCHCDRLRASTASGKIDLAAITATQIRAQSSFGSVHVAGCNGAVEAKSASGEVKVIDHESGAVRAVSSFGNVHVRGVLHEVDAGTESGDVDVRAEPGSTCTAPWSLWTSFGDVSCAIPEGFAAKIHATTEFGSIGVGVPIVLESSKQGDRSTLDGTLGTGGAELTIRVASGSIDLHGRQ